MEINLPKHTISVNINLLTTYQSSGDNLGHG